MKNGIKIISLLLLLVVTFQVTGCSSFFGPSDEEVIKAIEDAGFLKDPYFTVAAPVVVLEKNKQEKDGSWLVKIKLTLTLKAENGQTSTRVTTPMYGIHKSKDSAGKSVWTAKVGP